MSIQSHLIYVFCLALVPIFSLIHRSKIRVVGCHRGRLSHGSPGGLRQKRPGRLHYRHQSWKKTQPPAPRPPPWVKQIGHLLPRGISILLWTFLRMSTNNIWRLLILHLCSNSVDLGRFSPEKTHKAQIIFFQPCWSLLPLPWALNCPKHSSRHPIMPRLVFSIMLRLVSPISGLHSFIHIYLIAPPLSTLRWFWKIQSIAGWRRINWSLAPHCQWWKAIILSGWLSIRRTGFPLGFQNDSNHGYLKMNIAAIF